MASQITQHLLYTKQLKYKDFNSVNLPLTLRHAVHPLVWNQTDNRPPKSVTSCPSPDSKDINVGAAHTFKHASVYTQGDLRSQHEAFLQFGENEGLFLVGQ